MSMSCGTLGACAKADSKSGVIGPGESGTDTRSGPGAKGADGETVAGKASKSWASETGCPRLLMVARTVVTVPNGAAAVTVALAGTGWAAIPSTPATSTMRHTRRIRPSIIDRECG